MFTAERRLFFMADIQKLTALETELNQKKSKKVDFKSVVVVHVGCKPTEFFAKLKNEDGSQMKDSDGKDLRSEERTGWTYTFAQFGNAKTVKVVLRERVKVELLETYAISGLGYDIQKANMLFIDENGTIVKY